MEQEILTTIQNISYPAAITFIFFIFYKAGALSLLAEFLRGKINGDVSPTIGEKLDKISGNHLGEIRDLLMDIKDSNKRQEDKLEKMSDNIVYIKARLNKS